MMFNCFAILCHHSCYSQHASINMAALKHMLDDAVQSHIQKVNKILLVNIIDGINMCKCNYSASLESSVSTVEKTEKDKLKLTC